MNKDLEIEDELRSQTSEWSIATLKNDEANLGLYVFESIELEIGLLDDKNQEPSMERQFDHPILLDVDPSSPARYFCSHKAGVHCVGLPIITQLAEMAQTSDEIEMRELALVEHESIVEHLVCTRMSNDFAASPILGLALEHPPATLYYMLSDCSIEKLELSELYFQMPFPLPTESAINHSPLKSLTSSQTDSFEQKIKMMLVKDATLPKIKASDASSISSKECLEIITKSTKVFMKVVKKLHLIDKD